MSPSKSVNEIGSFHGVPMYNQYFPNPFNSLAVESPCPNSQYIIKPQFHLPKVLNQSNPISESKDFKEVPENEKSNFDEDFSLSNEEKPANERRGGQTAAYKKRNVYKSIIRSMLRHMRKYREDLIKMLIKAGYCVKDIEHAFYKLNSYNDMERQKGNKKKSQIILKQITKTKCIYSYILKETLDSIMRSEERRGGKERLRLGRSRGSTRA